MVTEEAADTEPQSDRSCNRLRSDQSENNSSNQLLNADSPFPRRQYLQGVMGAASIPLLTTNSAAAFDEDNPEKRNERGRQDFKAAFEDPAREVRPKFRWWWPHGKVSEDELKREINQIADAGFGGVEIADVHHSVEQSIDPEKYGWGTEAWNSAVEAALQAASDRNVEVDLTIGPSWPAAVPTVTPSSEAAAKEIAFGRTVVTGGDTYTGMAPTPNGESTDGRLVAVQAARLSGSTDNSEWSLIGNTLVDLSDSINADKIEWTAPDEGEWALIGFWQRGSGQRPEAGPHTEPPSYVVDHFSEAGSQAVIDYWESNLLTPKVRELLNEVGGSMFEDSLEIEGGTIWTPNLLEEFEQRMEYSLSDYLPLIMNRNDDPAFSFGGDTASQVRRDYWETLTHMYIENHVGILKKWVNSLGLRLRVQPYGLQTDAIAAAAAVDVPEGESLGFSNNSDRRCLAGGRDMGGNQILSEEAGGFWRQAYSTTWETILKDMAHHFSAGVNQAVVHGFSYETAPGVEWPGFAAFTPYDGNPGYAGSWGPRQPTWEHMNDVSGYISRNQKILQSETSKVDAAILRQKGYVGTGFGGPWFTPTGADQGYSYHFLSPELVQLPRAKVENEQLAPDGPGYKVFIVYEDDFAGKNTMLVETAEQLLEFAKEKLPIVVVGDNYDVPGLPQPGENEKLDTIFSQLIDQTTVKQVSAEADIGGALNELDIQPDSAYSKPAPLRNVHRAGENVDYYYLHNNGDETIDRTVSFVTNVPEGIPYQLDAWTGEIERVAVYKSGNGRVSIPISLAPKESTIIAIGKPNWYNDHRGRGLHATSTDAEQARFDDSGLIVRDTTAGTYQTTLSNGRTVDPSLSEVPDAWTLSEWQLSVEDWRPGDSPTETVTRRHELSLNELKPWTEISELEDVSGIGRYRTAVEISDGWTGGYGAYLDLGSVFDTFQVIVNGERLPSADQVNPVVDVGPYLKEGKNTIVVEMATTLNNRLRISNSDVYGVRDRQEYGLIGPVRLIPYGEAEVHERGSDDDDGDNGRGRGRDNGRARGRNQNG